MTQAMGPFSLMLLQTIAFLVMMGVIVLGGVPFRFIAPFVAIVVGVGVLCVYIGTKNIAFVQWLAIIFSLFGIAFLYGSLSVDGVNLKR